MIYVGMDVSSKSFVVHAIDEKKRVVKRAEIEPTASALRKLCKELGPGSKLVVFEAGNQMKWIADTLQKQTDVELHVVHPNEVKWIAESGGKKTDRVDAKKLAELARGDNLPLKVHIVKGKTREMRELVSARKNLMEQRVRMVNTLRGYMKQEGVRLSEKFFAKADWHEQLAEKKLSPTLRAIIEATRPVIEALREGETDLVGRLEVLSDKRTELLESIPGIGVLGSRTVVSALDDVKRFENRKGVANYGALTPTIFQTGEYVQLGRINRDGRQEVRRVMLQSAHVIPRMKSPAARPLIEFYERIEKKRGKKKAVVALARKLLVTCYGVLKSERPYDPSKVAAREDRREPRGQVTATKAAPPARAYKLQPRG